MKVDLKDIKERFPEFDIRNYRENAFFVGFSHDSRSVKKDEIYIPIEGENFDGHDFILDAFEKGASVTLCEKDKYDKDSMDVNKPIILVDNIEDGLMKTLNYAISHITAPVVAITGSTGKTITKQMLITILKRQMKVLYGDKSNTVWGNAVILSRYDDHDVVVLECGMDRKGEIAWHVNSVDPDLGILLNVGHVHGEKVGGIEAIYEEKKDLADYMERTGKPLVLNVDDDRLQRIEKGYKEDSELITFGKKEGTDFQIVDVKVDSLGTHFSFKYYDNKMDVHLKVFGDGYVHNAMAAIIAANRLGVSIDNCITGVELFESSEARFETLEYKNNVIIVNDAYNANPTSMDMSLKTFDRLYGSADFYKIAVLGDMRELGEVSAQKHKGLGEKVEGYNFDEVYYVGEMFEEFGVGEYLESADEVAAMLNIKLESLAERKVVILLKGSHSIRLYLIPDFLKKLGSI
jgi:UDP-N-acetylmuramoyl-tripeptide--D-alanyl-D-alanine ligase